MDPRQQNDSREVRFNALGYRRMAGLLVGAGAGALILCIGFWKALLICALAALGWWIGGGCYIPTFILQWMAKRLSRRDRAA